MSRLVMVCLISFCVVSEAWAGLVDSNAYRKLMLADIVEVRQSRYFSGYKYSRFPRPESKLQIPPRALLKQLDTLYPRSGAFKYTVRQNDTLNKISRRFGVTIELIKEINRRKSDALIVGQKLWIPCLALTIEIDKTFNRMYLKNGNEVIKEYPVSTGKSETQTPLGLFIVKTRYPFPTWFHKGAVIPGGSPENYLGSRWLGFDKPQFGIHGTIFPEYIGQSVSKGCVRMKNEDVEELYEIIPVGTMVMISET